MKLNFALNNLRSFSSFINSERACCMSEREHIYVACMCVCLCSLEPDDSCLLLPFLYLCGEARPLTVHGVHYFTWITQPASPSCLPGSASLSLMVHALGSGLCMNARDPNLGPHAFTQGAIFPSHKMVFKVMSLKIFEILF